MVYSLHVDEAEQILPESTDPQTVTFSVGTWGFGGGVTVRSTTKLNKLIEHVIKVRLNGRQYVIGMVIGSPADSAVFLPSIEGLKQVAPPLSPTDRTKLDLGVHWTAQDATDFLAARDKLVRSGPTSAEEEQPTAQTLYSAYAQAIADARAAEEADA